MRRKLYAGVIVVTWGHAHIQVTLNLNKDERCCSVLDPRTASSPRRSRTGGIGAPHVMTPAGACAFVSASRRRSSHLAVDDRRRALESCRCTMLSLRSRSLLAAATKTGKKRKKSGR
ncbi:hypothetical protein MRX96_000601 [Rhipicephalus microplus]